MGTRRGVGIKRLKAGEMAMREGLVSKVFVGYCKRLTAKFAVCRREVNA